MFLQLLKKKRWLVMKFNQILLYMRLYLVIIFSFAAFLSSNTNLYNFFAHCIKHENFNNYHMWITIDSKDDPIIFFKKIVLLFKMVWDQQGYYLPYFVLNTVTCLFNKLVCTFKCIGFASKAKLCKMAGKKNQNQLYNNLLKNSKYASTLW